MDDDKRLRANSPEVCWPAHVCSRCSTIVLYSALQTARNCFMREQFVAPVVCTTPGASRGVARFLPSVL